MAKIKKIRKKIKKALKKIIKKTKRKNISSSHSAQKTFKLLTTFKKRD